LCRVYEGLQEKLEASGRAHWLLEEMAILTDPSTYDQKSEDAWLKLAGRVNKAKELVVLRELAIWRDQEARARDVPRGRVLKDDALIDVATAAPRSVEALGKLRSIPNGFERSKTGADILECVERALAINPAEWPIPTRHKPKAQAGAVVDLMKVLLKAISEQEGVAAKIIATSDMLEELARHDDADIAALKGWRRELFGEPALALKRGELALTTIKGRLTFFNCMESV
jgi:ribonuclease D